MLDISGVIGACPCPGETEPTPGLLLRCEGLPVLDISGVVGVSPCPGEPEPTPPGLLLIPLKPVIFS